MSEYRNKGFYDRYLGYILGRFRAISASFSSTFGNGKAHDVLGYLFIGWLQDLKIFLPQVPFSPLKDIPHIHCFTYYLSENFSIRPLRDSRLIVR